jgi:acyl carrier protein
MPCRATLEVVASPAESLHRGHVMAQDEGGGVLLTPAQNLEKILRAHARFIPASADIPADISLASLGIDSLAMIELVVKIEDEFDLEIPPGRISPETFSTPASIWQLLCQLDPKLVENQPSQR